MIDRPWLVTAALTSTLLSGSAAMAGPPVISSFSPPSGPVGTLLEIHGNWVLDGVSISFGGIPAAVQQLCRGFPDPPGHPVAGCIKVVVPLEAATGPLSVTTVIGSSTSGTSTTATSFQVLEGPGQFTVINREDSAAGSLRWCLEQARAHPGFDYIKLPYFYSDPFRSTSCLTSPLAIDHPVGLVGELGSLEGNPDLHDVRTCDASRIPTIIELKAGSSGSTIQNLNLFGFSESAIVVESGSEGNWIQDNWIGFDPIWFCPVCRLVGIALSRTSNPDARGVMIQSSFNVVRNNTLSGLSEGIVIGDDPAAPTGAEYRVNAVIGNRVGTAPSGLTAASYGNGLNGLTLGAGARENWIGPGNVFSGNASNGVVLLHATNVGNVVFGNHIGVGADGSTLVGNGGWGVVLTGGANGNAVGGAAGHNEISGNAVAGVALGHAGGPATGNWVQNNVIGLNVAQTQSVGGQGIGVALSNGSQFNVVEGNAIAGNSQHGVCLWNSTSNGINGNWVGQSAYGTPIPNGTYGLCFVDSGFNFALGNAFGTNGAANVFEWNSPGNVFE